MHHGHCGSYNPNAYFMLNNKCKAGYPKDFCSTTELSYDCFALYARPQDNITYEKNGFVFENH